MSPDRWQQINDVLDALLALPPNERAAYLEAHHADDEALRDKVLELVAAYDEAESFLEQPVAEYAAPLVGESATEPVEEHQRVGPYRLLSRIARGGMGTVFLAARADEHFEKKVAVKLIRRGMDTDDVLRRFVSERQILARLEHPHIARLLDGCVTADDRPYFVMEYVEGHPLDRYCDRQRLPIRERLAPFLNVCEAVQNAHQNLVVHRDLKPSNILVTGDGTVKLLDFGIAKLLSDDDSEDGLTRTGMRVMTPEYAAPEQVRGGAITTATDVYALGILLYKLLTGRQPYRVRGAAPHEIERAILDAEPTRPSTAIATAQEAEAVTPEAISRDRGTSVSSLRRHLSGDLDTIILKTLKKEPQRRYASVQAFADDVQRYLDGLPVQARPDTLTYRTTKFVRRHRMGVAAAAVFLVLLASYALTTRTQAQRITVERDKAEQVATFLADVLKRADPFETADNVTVRQVLDRAAEQVETDLDDQPEVQAQLRHILSGVYKNLGQYDDALPHSEKALALRKAMLGERHPDVAASLDDLAELTCFLGDYHTSDSLYREALALRRDLFGEESEPFAQSLTDWGLLLYYKGERLQGLTELRRALALNRRIYGLQHPRVAESLHTLGAMHWAGAFGDSTRATAYRDTTELLVQQSLEMRQSLFEADHPDIVHSMSFLAEILRFKKRMDEAEPLFVEALTLHRQRLGNDHPYIATRLLGLARLRQDQQRYDEADTLATQAVALRRARLGDDHPETQRAKRELAGMRQGRL
jgi:serine/threonine-protein kinase